jgi:valyl-tRNA synthetase
MFMNVDRAQEQSMWTLEEFTQRPLNKEPGIPAFERASLEDRWIIQRFDVAAGNVHIALSTYRFHDAANAIYGFFWGDFCDWYIELIKPRLVSANASEVRTALNNLVHLFEASLRMLHPLMPFITEEIWQAIYDGNPPIQSIAFAPYPKTTLYVDEDLIKSPVMERGGSYSVQIDGQSLTEMAILQDLIVAVRTLRAELKVEQKQKVPIQVFTQEASIRSLFEQNRVAIERLANVESMTFAENSLSKLSGARSTARFDVLVVYEKKIDVAAERERLKKELEQIEKEIGNGRRQLSNEQFLAKAPAKVVEGMRKRLTELEVLREKIRNKLDELGPASS